MRCIATRGSYPAFIKSADLSRRANAVIRNQLQTWAIVLMSGFRAQSACVAFVIAALAPLLAGCDEPKSAVAATQTADPDVSVVTVNPQARAVVRELPGRIAPTRVAEVRPRVSGIIVRRTFSQGSEVKAGDPLVDGPLGAETTQLLLPRLLLLERRRLGLLAPGLRLLPLAQPQRQFVLAPPQRRRHLVQPLPFGEQLPALLIDALPLGLVARRLAPASMLASPIRTLPRRTRPTA